MRELICTLNQHILLVTLNRPDLHNAISHETMINALERMCEQANANKDVRVVIITGAGKSFCAGGNIKDMKQKTDMFSGSEDEIREAYKKGIQRIPLAMQKLEVPAIAAVNGAAIGAGFDLSMMCDIRIASEHARFAESFVKLGLIPGDGGAWFLPRKIGAARAAHMTLTGMTLDAQQALEWGIISERVSAEELLPRAFKIAEQIAGNPPQAVRETKRLLNMSEDLSLQEMLDACAKTQATLHHTAAHEEAISAFLEKRPPKFD